MDPQRVFGQSLRRIRRSVMMTQEKLAELSGLHRTYINGCENGHRNISLQAIVQLASALKVSARELMDGL